MSRAALFIRHQAQPGKREEVQRIWAKYVQPRVAANPAHEAYYFCYDEQDPDVVCVFQLWCGARRDDDVSGRPRAMR